MKTFYNLLVFKVHFNCCKVEGHYLPPQVKNDTLDILPTFSRTRKLLHSIQVVAFIYKVFYTILITAAL